MERLLTPLLMKYGRKYFKSWPDIKLSLWGGDVKLSHLEMNTTVIEKEFSLPFNVLSATIRELRIHVPWTALTSAPVEIFINSLEIHVVAKAPNSTVPVPEANEKPDEDVPEEETAVDLLGSWLDQILANISVRIENLTLKYQSGDVIISVSSKLLQIASSSRHPIWTKQFVDPGQYGLICKSFELSNVVVYLAEVSQTETNDPIVKCDSILARTLFYMLPEIPDDGGPSESQARVDFHVKKPLSINVTDKHVAILWKLINATPDTSSSPGKLKPQSPKMKNQIQKQKQLQQKRLQQQQLQQQQQQQPQSPQLQQQSQQQQHQQGWVSWAWGMVVEDIQSDHASGASITSVSLADVFATSQISLFIESIQVNLVPSNPKTPTAVLNVLACAMQLETSATAPDKQEVYFGVQVLDLSSHKDALVVLASTYVPHTYLPLTLFDPKYFEATEKPDPWKHFDAIRGKFVQESDHSIRNTVVGTVGDVAFTYNARAWKRVLEFTRYREHIKTAPPRPVGPIIHKYATPAAIQSMVETIWSHSAPPIVDITFKNISVVLPLSDKDSFHTHQTLTARLSTVSLSNSLSLPKKASDGNINWKDFMYNQYSLCVDDMNVCIDQEFIIEPFSATIQFGTHLIADSSILPFELPSLTASCAFHRLNISVTPFQYVMLTQLASNILSPEIPKLVSSDTCKIKFQLQGIDLRYELNHTYYKLEGGIASVSVLDVTTSHVRPIAITEDHTCLPSPSRDRRLCSFALRLPVSSDSAMPRAPSPHCPSVSAKFSGFSFSVDTKVLLPFINVPRVAAEVPVTETSAIPPLHAMWGTFVASGIQLEVQIECVSAFVPHVTSNALHLHLSRLNVITTSNPSPVLKARVDGLAVSLVHNFPFHLTRPHNATNSSKMLSEVDVELVISHANDPLTRSTLELATSLTKPILLEANKTQSDSVAIIIVTLLGELEPPNEDSVAPPPAPFAGYVTRSLYRIPQVATKLFVSDDADFITLRLTNLEASVTEAGGTTNTSVVLNQMSLEFSEFADVLAGPAWKTLRGNMISFPNKKPSEPFLRFEQVAHQGLDQLIGITTCSTEIVCVVPVLVKLANLAVSLSNQFSSGTTQQPQVTPSISSTEPCLVLNIGKLRLSIPQPSYPDSLHVFSLSIAAIKTSKPADDTLQLIASLLSLESASLKSEEDAKEITAPNTEWMDSFLVESILVPTNLMVDVQFELKSKKNISVVVESLSFVISKQVYHHLMDLVAWSNSFISTISTVSSPSKQSGPTQELQVTALLGIVEVALKSRKDTETFNLLLATENIQATYSVSAGGVVVLDNKIGNVLVKATHGNGDASLSRNVLIPNPAASRGDGLICVYSLNDPVQQATTIDIQPLSITIHEKDLRKLVDFFVPYTPPISISPPFDPATAVTSTTTLSATNSTKTNKTKVIVEDLELVVATGTTDAGNAIRLHSRQLFFAAQPFKAGIKEGTEYDLTIVDLRGAVVKRGHPFHILGPASAQISMLSTLPTFSLSVDIPLLSGHVNLPHINDVVAVCNSISDIFVAKGGSLEEAVEVPHTWTNNDLRLGSLRFIEERDVRPYSGEITFSRDEARLPWMSWRYAEPRAIGRISVMTPASIGSLRNERGYKCMLSHWDELHQEFVEISRFTLSDNIEPIVLEQQTFAYEFRVSVTSSISGISSPTTLAVSLAVNSYSSPARVPSFTCDVSCAVADLSIMRPIPGSVEELYMIHLDKFVYRMTSWKNLSAMKFYSSSHVGLAYHEHSNMNLVPLVEPFLLKLSMEKQLKSSPSPAPPLLLSSHAQSTTMTSPALPPSLAHKPVTSWTVNLQSQPIEVNISVDAVSHITKSIWEFQQSDPTNNPELYFRYSFENMTNEDLFFGQAGTDEGIFLPSKQSVLYSWRSKANQDLIDVWFAGSQRFGKPLNILTTGLKQCRITYKGWDVSSWILVEEKDLRTKVTIFGTHKLTNWLPFNVEAKIDLFQDQVHVLPTENSCGFFSPDNHVSHISLRLGPAWKWSIPVPLVQNTPVLVEITPEAPSPSQSPMHLWFQVNKNIEGGCLVSFWPIFFFKNSSSQHLEFSASTPQDVGVVKGLIPPGKMQATSITKLKSGNLFPVSLAMSPRKNIGFSFRLLQNSEKSTWSDPPIVIGSRSLPEAGRPDINRNLEISQHLVTMNGNEFARMSVKVKAMNRSPSICISFSFPSELRNESDLPIYFSPKVTKGNERSSLVIPVAPCQAIPFDHNTKSNNLDFSRIFIGVDCPTVGIIWSSKPLSTASKAQVVDVSLTSESGDLTRVFKFVCVVDPQKHTNRICIRPSLVVANQTGLALKLHLGESDVLTLNEKGTSTHIVSWMTNQNRHVDYPLLRLSTSDTKEFTGHNIDVSHNLSQARFSAPGLRTLVTYATSHSELTGVTTVVLFHDTHPPVVFSNELDIPVTYAFQVPVRRGSATGDKVGERPSGKVIEAGVRDHEESWDYEGFTEANDKNATSRLVPPTLMVRVQDSDAIGIDIVHDLHLSLVINSTSPEGETVRRVWVTVEVKGCTRFVYFRPHDVTAVQSLQSPDTTEWHISASIAEIGISLLEYSFNTKLPPPSPKITPTTPKLNSSTSKLTPLTPKLNASQSSLNSSQSDILPHNTSLRESLHVTLDGVQLRVETFAEEMSVVACTDVIQVDNYIPEFEFQVILAPLRDLTKTNAQIQPTIDLFLDMATGENSHLRDAAVSIKPMVLNLEDRHLLYLSAVAAKFAAALYVPPAESASIVERTDKVRYATTHEFLAEITEAPFYIAKLRINTISLHLTLHATVGIFLGIQHTHIPLPIVSLDKILATKRSLMEYLLAQYMAAGVLRGAAAVMSLELLGNPGGLIQEIWAGVRDALTLPLTGLARGSPTEFVDGVRGGTLSLVRHISHGTLGSVHVLSDALSRNLLQISMDSGLLANNWEAHQDSGGIRQGVTKGLKSFGYGIWSGLTGIVTEPVKGYMSDDSGIVIGVGKGLVGAITKPVLGFTELVSHTTGGILHSTSLSYLPARRRVVKPVIVTTASWTKVRTQFMSKHEDYVSHVLGSFITPNSTFVQCILLITTKRLIIIDTATEETCRTVATDSLQTTEDDKDKSNVIVRTPDVQICIQIVNASRRVAFVQALMQNVKK